MKQEDKQRKAQDDRLLKRLSMKERRQQEALRRMIQGDPIFKTIWLGPFRACLEPFWDWSSAWHHLRYNQAPVGSK